MVSVIIPVYNTEQYLKKCLESVRNQTYTDIEIIVVNDGSPDQSEIIINHFIKIDYRIRYYKKENGGLSSARNFGLLSAKGEFVTFVDSDDWIGPQFIENLMKTNTANNDIVIGSYTLVDTVLDRCITPCQTKWDRISFTNEEKNRHVFATLLGPHKDDKFKQNYQIMCVWKNLYRRSLLIMNNLTFYSEREVMLEDYDFNIRAYYKANTITFSNDVSYHHVIVANSLSRSYKKNLALMMINLYSRTESFLKDQNLHGYQDRLYSFIKKTSIDILYNASIGRFSDFKSTFNQIMGNELIKRAYEDSNKLYAAFYYRVFYFLSKYMLKLFLFTLFKMSRKSNYFYRLYKSKAKKY